MWSSASPRAGHLRPRHPAALLDARWTVRKGLYENRSMFERYNIINEEDLAQGVAQRFNGEQVANIEPSTTTPDSVTSSRSSS